MTNWTQHEVKRPNSIKLRSVPWVIEKVKLLEQELNEAYNELHKQRPVLKAISDRSVWNRVSERYNDANK